MYSRLSNFANCHTTGGCLLSVNSTLMPILLSKILVRLFLLEIPLLAFVFFGDIFISPAGEDSYLNVKECRGQFREYLNKAMRDTEYLEKKKALFKLEPTRKDLVMDMKFQSKGQNKKISAQKDLGKIQNPRRPFQNEMRILENKGILAFINEALQSNKSALRSGYSIQRLLCPGKSNKWKKANHLQSRSIGNDLGNVGRRRYKQTKSRTNNTMAHYESYLKKDKVPFLSAVKLKKYGSPRPPEKTRTKKSNGFHGKHRRVKEDPTFDGNGFHKSITLDEYFLRKK